MAQSWYNDYVRRLNQIKSQSGKQTGGTPSANLAYDAIRSHGSTTPLQASSPNTSMTVARALGSLISGSAVGDAGRWTIDKLSRGNYAMANPALKAEERGQLSRGEDRVYRNLDKTPAGTGLQLAEFLTSRALGRDSVIQERRSRPLQSVQDEMDAQVRGYSGEDKVTFSDVLDEAGVENSVARGLGGFTLDVATDPLNLIPASFLSKVYRGGGRVARAVIPGSKGPNAATNTLTKVDEVIDNGSAVTTKPEELADALQARKGVEVEADVRNLESSAVSNILEHLNNRGLEMTPNNWDEAMLSSTPALNPRGRDAYGLRAVQSLREADNFLSAVPVGREAAEMFIDMPNLIMQNGKVVVGDPIRQRISRDSLPSWRETMIANGFSTTEVSELARRANLGESQYKNYLESVMEQRFIQSLDIDGVIDGINRGVISTEDIKPLLDAVGVKTPAALKKHYAALSERVSKYQAKISEGTSRFTDGGLTDPFDLNIPVRGPEGRTQWQKVTAAASTHPRAEEILETAAQTGEQVLDMSRTSLSREQFNAIKTTMTGMNYNEFLRPSHAGTETGRKWITTTKNKNTARTSTTPGEGRARNFRGANRNFQYTGARNLLSKLRDTVPGWDGMTDLQRTETFMSSLKAMEDTYKAYNIPLIINQGDTGVPLSLHDVFSTLGNDWVARNYIDLAGAMPVTHTMRAAEVVVDTIRKSEDAFNPATGDNLYGAATDGARATQAIRSIAKEPLPPGKKGGKPRVNNFYRAARQLHKGPALQRYIDEEFVNRMINAGPELIRKVEENTAEIGLRRGAAVREISDEVLQDFDKAINSGGVAAFLSKYDNLTPDIKNQAKAHEAQNIPGINDSVKAEVELGLSDKYEMPMVNAAVKVSKANEKAGNNAAQLNQNSMDFSRSVQDEVNDMVNDMISKGEIRGMDIDTKVEWGFWANVFRRFSPFIGNRTIRHILRGNQAHGLAIVAMNHAKLAAVGVKYHKDQIRAAFHHIVRGDIEDLSPDMAAVVSDLSKPMRLILDPDNPQFDALHRNGITVDAVNQELARNGGKLKFEKSLEEWKDWSIDDPIDFLSRMSAAVNNVVTYRAVADTLVMNYGHKVPPRGGNYVKFTNADLAGKHPLFRHMDLDGTYFPAEIAQEIRVLANNLEELWKKPPNNAFWRGFDTVLHALKSGFTIYRPGHHARNVFSDIGLNIGDGVYDLGVYKQALQIMRSGRGKYGDFDFDRALITGWQQLPDSGKPVLRVPNVAGKDFNLNQDQAYALMFNHGLFPNHKMLEDLPADTFGPNGVGQRSLTRPFKGGVQKVASNTSEFQGHYGRATHFLAQIKRETPRYYAPNGRKFTPDEVFEDMAARAAERVRKWHPDAADLTGFEKTYMRRLFMFYSWNRLILPIIVGNMATRPGRFMAIPKAMHGIAEANGIDTESYADPFPGDQLFPSFLSESIQGPIMGSRGEGYWGMRIGLAQLDTFDELLYGGDSLGENIVEMGNPMIKAPLEYLAREKFNGTPVRDEGSKLPYKDWLIRQIPNMDYVRNSAEHLTDTDLRHVASSNVGYEPNSPSPIPNGLLSWLTGVGLVDMSKPSYIRSAQFEENRRRSEGR